VVIEINKMEDKNYPILPAGQPDDEITLRELILKIKEYYTELRNNWKILLLVILPCTAYFGYKAWVKPVTYTSGLTFMLNEEKGGGGISSILGQFGGLLGGGGGDYQLEKILEIARSRRIISSALFERGNINGQDDYFANHVIRIQKLHDNWNDDKELQNFFFTNADPSKFSMQENKALLALYAEFVGGEGADGTIFGAKLNEDTGIMSLSAATKNEMLSINLLNTLYKNISEFYISKSTEREAQTLAILTQKRDSIGRALYRNDYSSASFEDQSQGVLLQQDKVPVKRFNRNNQILSAVYAEAIKNVEIAEFSLKSSTPFLTQLDVPIAPIKPDPRGRVKALLTGFILGFILGAVFVVGRKVVRGAMSEE
jgi:hypothetical protein